MADRSVSWRADAHFDAVRREANRTRRDLEALRREQDQLAARTAANSATSTAANRREEQSSNALLNRLQGLSRARRQAADDAVAAARAEQQALDRARASRDADTASRARSSAQAQRSTDAESRSLGQLYQARVQEQRAATDSARASRESAAARDEETASGNRFINVVRRMAQARRENSASAQAEQRAQTALTNAREQETQAVQRAEAANLRLQAAKDRVSVAEQRAQQTAAALVLARQRAARAGEDDERATSRLARAHSDASSAAARLAQAHSSVSRATNDVARAQSTAENATRRAERAMLDLNNSGNNNRGIMSRLGSGASSAADGFGRLAMSAGGAVAKLTVMGSLISFLVSTLGSLAGGLYAVASAMGPVLGLVGALPGMVLGAGTAIGTLVAGFSGIGNALKLYGKQQQAAGKNAAQGAAQAKAAADRIKEAKQAVSDAQMQAARDAKDAATRVTEAEQSAKESVQQANAAIVDAVKNAAQQRKQADEQVARAKEQAAASIEAANNNVLSSEKTLANAQADARAAQLGLNTAREQAIQNLKDMKNAARDAAFSEEEAALALAEARERLMKAQEDPTTSDLELRQADLNYREAQARYSDARDNKAKAEKANADAQKKGVAGSDIMAAAQQRVADSLQKVADAQAGLVQSQKAAAKAQIDAARSIKAAEDSRNQTIVNGAKSVADAQKNRDKAVAAGAKSVAAAKQAQADQQVSSAKSIKAAEDNLTKAIEAQKTQMQSANAAANEYAAAMAKLTPAGRSFVLYLISLKGKLDELKAAAAQGLLPGVERGLRSLMTLFPLVKKTVANTAKILGDGVAQLGKTLSSAESQGIWARVFKTNEDATKNLTKSMSPLAISLLRIMDAARPLVLWMSQLVLQFANYADKTTKTNTENGKMAKFFESAKNTAHLLGQILGNLVGIFYNVGKAGSDTGRSLLEEFRDWTEKMKNFTGSLEGQNKLKKWFEDIRPGIESAARLIGKISKLLADMAVDPNVGPGLDAIGRIVDSLGKSKINESLSKSLTDIANSIANILDNGGGGVLTAMVGTIAKMLDVFAGFTSISGVPQILTAIAVALGAIKAVKLVGAITGISGLARSVGQFRQGVRGGTNEDGTPQGSLTGRVAGRVGRRINRTSTVQGARNRVSATRSRVSSRLSSARTRISRRGGGADPTESIIAGTNANLRSAQGPATTAGANVSSGFANGIRERLSTVRNAANSVARAVLERFRSIFRMHSPSLVMTDYGINTIQGFINGMRERLGGVRTMAREVGQQVTNALRRTPAQAEAAGAATATAVGSGVRAGGRRQRGGRPGMGRAMGVAGGVGAAAAGLSMLPGPLGDVAGKIMMVMMVLEGLMALFAAFSAPVLIIIGVVVALGAAFYLLFTKNKTFHDWVMKAWGALKNLAIAVWQNGILPALKAVANFMTTKVGPAFVWLWQSVIKPTFSAIGTFIGWTWKNVIKPALDGVVWFFKNILAPVVKWLYENVVKNYFRLMGLYIKIWWTAAKIVFDAFVWFFKNVLAPVVKWLYNSVIKPYFTLIGNIIKGAWDNVIKPVFNAIKSFVTGPLATAFRSVRDTISGVWSTIKSAIKTAWDATISKVFSAIKTGVGKVADAFNTAKDGISTAWNKVQDIAKKPIKFVLDTVLRNGLIKGFNWISDKVGGPHIDPDKIPHLATGGRVRGNSPTPTADNVPAMLTAGEWVQPVSTVKHYGAAAMEAIRQRRIPKEALARFAGGGRAEGPEMGLFRANKLKRKKQRYRDGGLVGAHNYSLGSQGGAATLSNYYNADAEGHEHNTGSGAKIGGGSGGTSVPYRPQMHSTLIAFGKLLRSRGVSVLENPAFGQVHPVHMKGSLHYAGQAMDVSGGPNWPKSGYGIYNEALRRGLAAIWQSKGHYDHVHVDTGIWKEYHNKTSLIGGNVTATSSDEGNFFTNTFNSLKDLLGNINPVTKLKSFFMGSLNKLANNDMGKMLRAAVLKPVGSAVSALKNAFFGSDKYVGAGTDFLNPFAGATVSRWSGTVKQALSMLGIPAKPEYVKNWLTQIGWESSGNPSAIQGNIGDINNRTGQLARGLVQVVPGTFAAYHMPGYDNIFRGLDNLLAGMRYARATYGLKGFSNFIGRGRKHGYATGGQVRGHGNVDSVDALLMPGEFVVRRDAARAIGYDTLHAMNNIDRPGYASAGAGSTGLGGTGVTRFATGGKVAPPDGKPINSMLKPGGARMFAWKMIHELLGLKVHRGLVMPYPNNWDSEVTRAFANKNYQVPDLSTLTAAKSVGGYLKPLVSWMQSYQNKLSGHTAMERYPYLSPRNASKHPSLTRTVQKILGIKTDGIYGSQMGKAVVAYKKNKHLGSANEINRYTWKQLAEDRYPSFYGGTKSTHTPANDKRVRIEDVANRYGISMWQAAALGQGSNMDYIKKHVLNAASRLFLFDSGQMSGSNSWWNGSLIKSFQSMFGMPQTGTWTTTMGSWITYAMRKALKKPTDTIFPPWWTLDPAQQAIETQGKNNKNQSEFLKDLDILSSWGLNFLVEKLQSDGVEEGLPVARASVKSRPLAEQYNKQLQDADAMNKTGTEDYTKYVAAVQAPGEQLGIRGMAQALGIADYAVVTMFKELVKSGRLKSGGERTSRLEKEIRMFDKGLFYAATGGRVPGAGNSDTVPSMLTPGEFVLRKAAVKAIGLDNLEMLNAQKFNSGGLVYSMGRDSMSNFHDTMFRATNIRRLGGDRMLLPDRRTLADESTRGLTQEFYTNIYNPVRERSTRSFNAALRTQGQFGGATIVGDVTTVRERKN